jgi:hypothetical protein
MQLERRVDDLMRENEELILKLRSAETEKSSNSLVQQLHQELKKKDNAIVELKLQNSSLLEKLRVRLETESLQSELGAFAEMYKNSM